MWYTAQVKMISEWLTERKEIALHPFQLNSLQNITKVDAYHSHSIISCHLTANIRRSHQCLIQNFISVGCNQEPGGPPYVPPLPSFSLPFLFPLCSVPHPSLPLPTSLSIPHLFPYCPLQIGPLKSS